MIYRILRKGEVRVNKKRISLNINSKRVMKYVSHRFALLTGRRGGFATSAKGGSAGGRHLYEDDHILVLNKPSGTAVHAAVV